MKKVTFWRFVLFFLLVLEGASCQAQFDRFETAKTAELKVFSFLDAEGKTITTQDLRGKVLILSFWATWCRYCLSELPSLNRLAEQFGEKDFVVLAVCKNEEPEKVREAREIFKKEDVRHLKLVFDPNQKAFSEMNIRGLPTSIILDRQGYLIGRQEGATEWDHCDVIDGIRGFIRGKIPDRHSWYQKMRAWILFWRGKS